MDQPFLGMIAMFGFAFAPRGWAFCAGQMLAISSNSALFSLLGTTYGGNGTTTFGLPDLQGRTAIGMGNGPGLTPRQIGQIGGSENTTLNNTQMPAHSHGATATSNSTSTSTSTSQLIAEGAAADAQNPNGKMLAIGSIYTTPNAANNRNMAPESITTATTTTTNTTTDVTVQLAGGNQPFNNMQPFLAVNYCIALQGIFPSRN